MLALHCTLVMDHLLLQSISSFSPFRYLKEGPPANARFARKIFFICRFDANSPYTATSVGITTQIPRRPHPEWTLRNKNLACIYAGKTILHALKSHEE